MISPRNTILPSSNADLHDAVRDIGPEPITASVAMGAVPLLDAVRHANAPRLTVRAALVAGVMSHLDLLEPEEFPEF